MSSSSSVVRRVISISNRKHRAPSIESSVNSLSPAPASVSVLPDAGVAELTDAVKFVRFFSGLKPLTCPGPSAAQLLNSISCYKPSLKKDKNSKLLCNGREEWRNCGLVAEELVDLVSTSRKNGHHLSADCYCELLSLSLTLSPQRGDQQAAHPGAVRLVQLMAGDLDKDQVKLVVYSSALQSSQTPAQIDKISRRFKNEKLVQDKLARELLIEGYLKTEATPRPSLSRLLSQQDSPSPLTFHRVILACAHKYQLSRCLGVYHCMTRTYKMAPTRKVYSVVTRLLSETFGSDQSPQWKLRVSSKVLADTLHSFRGQPPAWVYSEMSKPLSLILGVDGYNQMLEISGSAAKQYCASNSEASITDVMRGLWTPPLFHSLFSCAQWSVDPDLALQLLSDYKLLYHSQPRSGAAGKLRWPSTFRSLLDLINSPQHLTEYLPTVMEEMADLLTVEQLELFRLPLTRALERAYANRDKKTPVTVAPHLRKIKAQDTSPTYPAYLSKAASTILDTVIGTSCDQCITDLEQLAAEGSDKHNPHRTSIAL